MSAPSLTLTPTRAAVLTGQFVLWQFGFFALVGIASGIATLIKGLPAPTANGVDPVALIFVNSTAAFLVLHGQMRKSRLSWGDFLHSTTRWVLLLPTFALIMIGETIVLSEAENRIIATVPPPLWLQAQFSGVTDLVRNPFSAPFVLIVVAAVTEEFLFRGLILRGLLARISPLRAVLVSAVLFAVMHLNPWQMCTAFVLGLIFGWVYLRTRSLALCIVGHGFHNAMSVLANGLPFTVDGFNREHASDVVLHQPWWFSLLGVAALALGVCFFNHIAPVSVWPLPVSMVEPPPLPVAAGLVDSPEGKA